MYRVHLHMQLHSSGSTNPKRWRTFGEIVRLRCDKRGTGEPESLVKARLYQVVDMDRSTKAERLPCNYQDFLQCRILNKYLKNKR